MYVHVYIYTYSAKIYVCRYINTNVYINRKM